MGFLTRVVATPEGRSLPRSAGRRSCLRQFRRVRARTLHPHRRGQSCCLPTTLRKRPISPPRGKALIFRPCLNSGHPSLSYPDLGQAPVALILSQHLGNLGLLPRPSTSHRPPQIQQTPPGRMPIPLPFPQTQKVTLLLQLIRLRGSNPRPRFVAVWMREPLWAQGPFRSHHQKP